MNSLPCVDVVILSWNRAKLTIETIENVLNQEGVQPRIWIIDQGSTLDNLELIRSTTNNNDYISIKELGNNLGVPAGRNVGMKLGKEKYIVSIDNDAIFESPNAMRDIVDLFETQPDVGVIGLRIKNYYTKTDDELGWTYPKAQLPMRDQQFLTTRFPGGAHAIRRKVVNEAGDYDERLFFYWEEVDLSYRVLNLGYKIIYAPSIAILHKISPESRISWGSERFYYVTRNAIYLQYKYYKKPLRTLMIAMGYIIKGMYNRAPIQAVKGTIDAIKMCITAWSEINSDTYILNEQARSYIWENERRYRGSLWNRVKNEVFTQLPGRDKS
jgi:GT2 family glycosyltransferase